VRPSSRPQRAALLAAVLAAALDDGIGYWAHSRSLGPGQVLLSAAEEGNLWRWPPGARYRLTLLDLDWALELIAGDGPIRSGESGFWPVDSPSRRAARAAYLADDLVGIDSTLADLVVQVAVFGRLVYR